MENNSRKKIIASSAAYILGLNPQVKIQGNSNQVKRFQEVLVASRDLYSVLQEGSLEEVEDKLSIKKKYAKRFYEEFGWQWPF